MNVRIADTASNVNVKLTSGKIMRLATTEYTAILPNTLQHIGKRAALDDRVSAVPSPKNFLNPPPFFPVKNAEKGL